MAEDADIAERLSAIESAQAEQSELLQSIVDRLAKLESKKASGGGKKKAGPDKSKALKPSVAKKPTSGGKKKPAAGSAKKKPAGGGKKKAAAGGGGASARVKVPDERKVTYRFGKANITVARPSEGYPDEEQQDAIPDEELAIEWVHGFAGNGDDGNKAITCSPDGTKLIYFIACFGVVYDVESGKQQYFQRHSDDITCIALNPKNSLVATGQKDPKDEPGQGKSLPCIYVWDSETMKPVAFLDAVCERKVLRVCWSAKTGMLYSIAGDDDQSMRCYDPETFTMKGNAKPIMEFSTYRQKMFGFIINPDSGDEYFDELLGFGPRQFTRMMITGDAEEGNFEFSKKTVSVTKFRADSEKAFTDAIYLSDGRYAVAGASGNVYLGRGDTVGYCVQCHEKAVGCLAELPGNRLATAGHDEIIKFWEILGEEEEDQLKQVFDERVTVDGSDFIFRPKAMARVGESDQLFIGSKTNQIIKYTGGVACDGDDDEKKEASASVIVDGHDGEIWGIACHPTEALFCTGGYDNAIKIWDAPSHRCIKTLEFPIDDDAPKHGREIDQVAWSEDGELIVVGTEDSYLGCVAWPSLEFLGWTLIPKKSKSAAVENVSYLRFSPDGKRLAVGHMDANLYVFDIIKKKGAVTLKTWAPLSCGTAVSHVRWAADSQWIQVMTRDYQIMTFKLDLKKKKGKHDPYLSDPDVVEMAGDPLIAGWDVQGLYQIQEEWDGTDLNDASVSPDGKLIVSGDDYGNVRLHNYPAIKPEACRKYPGHAEFVVGIEFLSAHPQVISCGGKDMCVVQWAIDGAAE